MQTYLITGGAGFIGSNLAVTLVERGHRVRVLDDFSSGNEENLRSLDRHERFELVRGSLEDASLCRRALEGVDYVLHEAAIPSVPRSVAEPEKTDAVNIHGTLILLEAIRERKAQIRRVVFASSSATYGEKAPGEAKSEEMIPDPLSPYAVQKLACEYYAKIYTALHNIPTVALRYFNVFGPRQDPKSLYAAVIPRFVESVLLGRAPVIYGDGGQSRDFCYIDNIVEANLLACTSDRAVGGLFNIACGEAITLVEVVGLLEKMLGRKIAIDFEPARSGDIRHSLASILAARRVLGYEPKVRFAEGLKRTIVWHAQRLGVDVKFPAELP